MDENALIEMNVSREWTTVTKMRLVPTLLEDTTVNVNQILSETVSRVILSQIPASFAIDMRIAKFTEVIKNVFAVKDTLETAKIACKRRKLRKKVKNFRSYQKTCKQGTPARSGPRYWVRVPAPVNGDVAQMVSALA